MRLYFFFDYDYTIRPLVAVLDRVWDSDFASPGMLSRSRSVGPDVTCRDELIGLIDCVKRDLFVICVVCQG